MTSRLRRIRTIVVRALVGVLGVVTLALGSIYGVSEWMLRRSHDAPLEKISVRASAADLAEGERLSRIIGCWAGCHGPVGQGGVQDAPGIFRATAPTLNTVLPLYRDDELVRLIRYGIKRDGRTAIGMVAGTFYPLSKEDLEKIIAHLRRQPASPPIPRERHVALLGRIALATAKWKTSADEVDRAMPRWGELPRRTPFERGRYLCSVTCTECHGADLQGKAYEGSPSLRVVAAYDLEQFQHLLRTGKPISGRDLGIMSSVSRNGFAHFTDQEIADLYSYLRAHYGLS